MKNEILNRTENPPKANKLASYKLKASHGFTLVELLIVIAIIGILTAVVIANLTESRTKARDAKRVADIKKIQLDLEFYFSVNSAYPPTLSALVPTYSSNIPTDPTNSGSYTYRYFALGSGSTCSSYHLMATLEHTPTTLDDDDADASAGTTCALSATPDVAGTDPIFDVKSQ